MLEPLDRMRFVQIYICIFVYFCIFPFQNVFSALRSRGGFNDNPTVVQAHAAIRAITCNELLQSTSTSKNCENVDSKFLLPSLPVVTLSDSQKQTETVDDTPVPELPVYSTNEQSSSESSQPTDVHYDAYAYVAGYTIRRFITCSQCKTALLSPTVRTPFIEAKCYSGCTLQDPVNALTNDVMAMEVKTLCLLDQVAHLEGVSKIILERPEISCLFYFDFIHEKCRKSVQDLLLNAFCRFFIRVFCLRKNEKMKTSKKQTLSKFKKLVK